MARLAEALNPHLEPHRLSHFLAVLEQGGFNRAAKVSGVTQQALSKSISKLELALGVKLFERTALGVTPTIFAEQLATRARIIIAEARIAASEIEALRGFRSGLVRIGAGPSLAARRVPRLVAELRRRMPDVGIMIRVGDTPSLSPMLARGDLDIIVSAPFATIALDEDLESQIVGVEVDQVVGRVAHPLALAPWAPLVEFTRYPWVGEARIGGIPARLSDICAREGLPAPVHIISTDSISVARGLLIESDALCLLSPDAYAVEFEAGLLAPIPRPEFEAVRRVRVFRRRRAQPSAAARLAHDMIVERLRSELQPDTA